MNNNKKRRVMGEEDDPGPGQVGVQVRGSGRVFLLDKRSAVAKSDYFKSHFAGRFPRHRRIIELDPEICTVGAVSVLTDYINTDYINLSAPEEAEEVLKAANFLLLVEAQDFAVESVKKLVSRKNFVNFYHEYCVSRNIRQLEPIITSIVRPGEAARRRKYGKFDLRLRLHQLDFPCHKAVVSAVCQKVKTIIADNPDIEMIEGRDLGVDYENAPAAYNMLESVYLNQQGEPLSSVSECLTVMKLCRSMQWSSPLSQSCMDYLSRHISVSSLGQIYQSGLEAGLEDVRRLALLYLAYRISQPGLQSLFLSLSLQDVCRVLSESRLNVPDEATVAELAIKWAEQPNKVRLVGKVKWT